MQEENTCQEKKRSVAHCGSKGGVDALEEASEKVMRAGKNLFYTQNKSKAMNCEAVVTNFTMTAFQSTTTYSSCAQDFMFGI